METTDTNDTPMTQARACSLLEAALPICRLRACACPAASGAAMAKANYPAVYSVAGCKAEARDETDSILLQLRYSLHRPEEGTLEVTPWYAIPRAMVPELIQLLQRQMDKLSARPHRSGD